MESSEAVTIALLLKGLNNIFTKECLRKNTYIFNALNERMELSLKIITQERRIAQITQDQKLILAAVKLCPELHLLNPRLVRVLMKGDQTIAKIAKNISSKDIQLLTKKIKCEIREQENSWYVEFHSPAACREFVQRVKEQKGEELSVVLIEKDPYECLKQSIANAKKQKKMQNPQINNFVYNEYCNIQYPIFIRKAIDSQEESQ